MSWGTSDNWNNGCSLLALADASLYTRDRGSAVSVLSVGHGARLVTNDLSLSLLPKTVWGSEKQVTTEIHRWIPQLQG